MVLAKSKKSVGLGNQLMKDRFGKGKGTDRRKTSAVTRTNHATGEQYIVNDREEASWVKMRSVTEQGALDEFLATATLAGTDFAAEKMHNVQIIHPSQTNRFLLSAQQENTIRGRHKALKHRLAVPRRPKWDENTTAADLDALEREVFLEWRRNLADLEEVQDLLMTPFERNLEVWRQLWRVNERSDLIVQIVDARNPLLFRSEDLEDYVSNMEKKNMLLINKSDMLTLKQRKMWAKYLKENKIEYRFFSAELANEALENASQEGRIISKEDESYDSENDKSSSSQPFAEKQAVQESQTTVDDREKMTEDTRILTIDELQDMFLQYALGRKNSERKFAVGLVGYPNVGKSSTINALCGAKKVSVSATPGKTKHFQTIHLSDDLMLCDCPGLVFPNFAATKAELVCNGILPIDQLREYTGPTGLVAQRFPVPFLEAIYGIKIRMRPIEEGGTGVPTANELLDSHARARGFYTTGHGTADESRAARLILKDYVSGKLLYCEAPPGTVDAKEFNRELFTLGNVPAKRRAALENTMETMALGDGDSPAAPQQGSKSKIIDKAFFGPGGSNTGHISRPFHYGYTEQGKQKQLSGRKEREMYALVNGLDPKDVRIGGKKHFKGGAKGRKKPLRDVDD